MKSLKKTAIVLIILSTIPLLFFAFTELKYYFSDDYLGANIGGAFALCVGLLLLTVGILLALIYWVASFISKRK